MFDGVYNWLSVADASLGLHLVIGFGVTPLLLITGDEIWDFENTPLSAFDDPSFLAKETLYNTPGSYFFRAIPK